jgi:basic membrane protein A
MNKKGTLLLVLILGVSLLGGSIVKATVKQTPTEFAIVFATGGLGDKSFNDAAYRGMEQAIAKYGSDINVDYVEPQTIDEFATYQDDLAKLGKYELIICVGFLQTSALNVSADTYTGTDWLLIDAVLDKTNVQSITFKEHEGSFLVGAMAGMVTATDKIGFLGGLDIYLINKFRAGYEQGAKYINPDIKITSVYSPDPTNPWGDIPGGKETGQNLYSQGNDVVYAAAGGTGIGVMQAANETADVYAIGVDSDQDYLAKGKVLCSMLKLVETAVFTSIDGKMQDTWTATHKELGLKEDGVGISPMNFTQSIKNGNFELNGTTKTRWEWIQDIKAKIISGEIVVSDTPEPDVTPVPGFEGSTVIFIVVLLGFAASHIRKRR